MVNIKLIPEAYILKRWTKEARSGIVQDNKGKDIVEDPKFQKLHQYKSICKKFARMASRAVDFDESYFLLDSSLDSMNKTIEEKIKEIFKPEDSNEESSPVPQQALDSRVAGLKKRDGRKSNKRPKSWVESMQEKAKKKDKKQAKPTEGKSKKRSKSGTSTKKGPDDEVQCYNNNVTTNAHLMAP